MMPLEPFEAHANLDFFLGVIVCIALCCLGGFVVVMVWGRQWLMAMAGVLTVCLVSGVWWLLKVHPEYTFGLAIVAVAATWSLAFGKPEKQRSGHG